MNIFTEWLETYFDEVTPREFYRDLFPDGELDQRDEFTKGKYTGIIIAITSKKNEDGYNKIEKYILTDDLKEIDKVCKTDHFCLCAPLSYAGRSRSSDNARFCYGIAVDLDKIRVKDGLPIGLMNLWDGHICNADRIPKPTYIVSSGTGLHLYYMFETALPLYRNVAQQLQKYKYELTKLIWNEGIVNIKSDSEIQQEGIYQGFRMPGTITKSGDRVRAFQTGEKVTMEYMNDYVKPTYRVVDFTYKSPMTLREAKEKYPEWYQERVVNKTPRGVWHTSRNVYEWWKQEILSGARVGHRYHCMRILSVYAQKCSYYDAEKNPNPVTKEELARDCDEILDYFESMTVSEDNHFTSYDMIHAMDSFNDKWVSYPLTKIEEKSGITVKRNKRNKNPRKRADHIKRVNATRIFERDVLNENPYENNGRPSKESIVIEYQALHPEARKVDCIRDTGLSKPTVYKYWKNTEVKKL